MRLRSTIACLAVVNLLYMYELPSPHFCSISHLGALHLHSALEDDKQQQPPAASALRELRPAVGVACIVFNYALCSVSACCGRGEVLRGLPRKFAFLAIGDIRSCDSCPSTLGYRSVLTLIPERWGAL